MIKQRRESKKGSQPTYSTVLHVVVGNSELRILLNLPNVASERERRTQKMSETFVAGRPTEEFASIIILWDGDDDDVLSVRSFLLQKRQRRT